MLMVRVSVGLGGEVHLVKKRALWVTLDSNVFLNVNVIRIKNVTHFLENATAMKVKIVQKNANAKIMAFVMKKQELVLVVLDIVDSTVNQVKKKKNK